MTTELSECLDDLSILGALYGPSTSDGSYLPSDLVDLVLGQSLKVLYHLVNNQLPSVANWNLSLTRLNHRLYMRKARVSKIAKTHGQMTSLPIGPTMPI